MESDCINRSITGRQQPCMACWLEITEAAIHLNQADFWS
jgi:hypothetical protein